MNQPRADFSPPLPQNIMKLAQGEYVALENIESIYGGSPLVAQLYVHGDGLQSYLIGVAVPDPVQFATLVSRVRGQVPPSGVALRVPRWGDQAVSAGSSSAPISGSVVGAMLMRERARTSSPR